jgi:hypothetical protein
MRNKIIRKKFTWEKDSRNAKIDRLCEVAEEHNELKSVHQFNKVVTDKTKQDSSPK